MPVIKDEHPLAEWLTGLRSSSGSSSRRTVVVQSAHLLGDLIDQGLVDANTDLFLGDAGTATRPAALTAGWELPRTFTGSFALFDSDILLDNGYRMLLRQYGTAEFHCLETPTALRVTDAHDLSAYLRDADEAWSGGVFARHVTHPNAITADLAALGGGAQRSGPADRLYVFPDAAVSTSPTGAVLGTAADQLPAIIARWQRANQVSAQPDAIGLGRVVDERDRTDALTERPWISRYLLAVSVIRAVRRSHRIPDRVSGFGGRLTPGLAAPTTPDDLLAPVLLRVGNEYQAYDGRTGAHVVLPAGAVATIEQMLTPDDVAGARSATGGQDTLRMLAAAGISEQWRRDFQWEE